MDYKDLHDSCSPLYIIRRKLSACISSLHRQRQLFFVDITLNGNIWSLKVSKDWNRCFLTHMKPLYTLAEIWDTDLQVYCFIFRYFQDLIWSKVRSYFLNSFDSTMPFFIYSTCNALQKPFHASFSKIFVQLSRNSMRNCFLKNIYLIIIQIMFLYLPEIYS